MWKTNNMQPAHTPIILIIASFATAAGDTVSFMSSSSGTYTMRSQLEHFSQTDVPQITQLWRRWINPNWSWHLLHRSAILPYCNGDKIISCCINHQKHNTHKIKHMQYNISTFKMLMVKWLAFDIVIQSVSIFTFNKCHTKGGFLQS